MRWRFISACLAVALFCSAGTSLFAAEGDLSVEEITARSKASVVVITTAGRDQSRDTLGTGFVVSADGLIATNYHVIGEGRSIGVVTGEGKTLAVEAIHAWDRRLDLAVIRVKTEQDLVPFKLRLAGEPVQGEPIAVLGNPRGLKQSVVAGVLSGVRDVEGRGMLQVAAPIEPGNSGGPVLDRRGEVLGIVTMKSAVTDNLGFASTSADLQSLLEHPNSVPLARWLTIGAIDPKQYTSLFGSRWSRRGGKILVSGAGEGFGGRALLLRNAAPPEVPFEIGVWVKLDDEAGAAGLAFCADGEHKHYGFYPTAGKMRLTRFDGPDVLSWKILGETTASAYRAGEWNALKVRVEADKLVCFVNDEQVFESPDRVLVSGKIGLCKFRDTRAEFRSFAVGAKLPPSRTDDERLTALAEQLRELPKFSSMTSEKLREFSHDDVAAKLAAIERETLALKKRSYDLRLLAADLRTHTAIRELLSYAGEKEKPADLLRAALAIAHLEGEEFDSEEYVAAIEGYAAEIESSLPADASFEVRMAALRKFLFEENGFHGSHTAYYDRENSYLNRVIDDREGLPITLALLVIELGKRLDLPLAGVSMPGHFLIGSGEGEARTYLDPFEKCRELSREETIALCRRMTGRDPNADDLNNAAPRAILHRMLNNLLGIAQNAGDREAMLRMLEAMLALDDTLVRERVLRALMRIETGRRAAALEDIDHLIRTKPPGVELERLEGLRNHVLSRPE